MISPKSLMKIATTASVVAMTVSVAVVPAYAMQDIAIEDTPSSFAATVDDAQNSSNSMPDNPNATLPETVSENISDDSTVVSENLAVTPEGDVQNIETGETVTDAQLVGTQSQQPDPLAKTDGESFIPVSASDVKDAVEQPVKQSAEQSSLKGGSTVRLAKFESNEYGAHWGTYNGTKAFFDYRNNLFVQQAKGVIDVSSWQGDVDWAKAKADGVEGAIIRLGYGWGNYADAKAQRNINECKRLGIPFGIYWYSYAYDANCARAEGNDVAAKLRQMGVSPNDLKYPVYYDLEKWTWAGHTPPTNPNVYSGMADAWYGALQSAGYKNLGVYSYTSYLQGPLNNSNIYAKTRWVAQYGAQMGYNAFGTNDRGWQYTSSGRINGISGSVDMNAFGNKATNVASGKWVYKDGRQYWQEKDGSYAQGKEIYDPSTDAWYWIDANGVMAQNKDVYLRSNGGKWVRYDSNGRMVKGGDFRYGAWYNFDFTTGAMSKGMTYLSDEDKYVYYDETTGKMIYGEVYLGYDDERAGWYMFDAVTGARRVGDVFIRSNGGKWVRYDRKTGKMVKGLQKQNGSWYYFDPVTGAMAHGNTWVPQWQAWHYFDNVTGRG
ncbi:1,4-beta-N-acetylmuramidase [Bifidobacterium adolescentis]|uniref:1,4-beta-N-acetylmuramidase n=1 Tax=Bifidobacterium adolescentis TaxID=1680 RepID=A0A2R4G516_BIFAD|nr:GH25 family lysozyme [Bifidobacterium adolescentis]AVT45934.1 1,4-beta-N-acetylmuramidase [Bifidobacterium adolescentis]